MRARALVMMLALAGSAACKSGEDFASIGGLWNLVGYRDTGVNAQSVSGTANFQSNGTVAFSNVIIVFAGQAPDTINSTMAWTQSGSTLTLTDSVDTSTWSITYAGNQAILDLLNDLTATRLTLQRP